jgi:hypothetical protein
MYVPLFFHVEDGKLREGKKRKSMNKKGNAEMRKRKRREERKEKRIRPLNFRGS